MTLGGFQENCRMAVSTLRARKMRSLLTILGVVIGVAGVIAVSSILDGLRRAVENRVTALGSRAYFVTRLPLSVMGSRKALPERLRRRKFFDYSYGDRLREMCRLLDAVSLGATNIPGQGRRVEIRYGPRSVDRVLVRGAEPPYADAIPIFEVEEGRFLNREDLAGHRRVAVLGVGLAQSLFAGLDPIGREMHVNGKTYSVVGLLPADNMFGGSGINQMAVIPTSTFRREFPEARELVITVSIRADADRHEGYDEVVAAMRRIRNLPVGGADDFEVTAPDLLTTLWDQLTGALVTLAMAVSSIGLLVGGVGVMNVMLISVAERTAEIGMRKAIGARRADIRQQFLFEAILLTFAGGVLGVALGGAIAFWVRWMVPTIPATLSYQWVALGLLISAGVGLFFGFLPANRAAKLDPIVGLRYE